MKRALWTTFSFLIITLFVGFLRYLITPLWPNLSDFLLKISENVKSSINIGINPYVISLIIFVVFFIVAYTVLMIITSKVRKKTKLVRDEINPNVKYESAPYTIIKIILIIIFTPLIYGFSKSFIYYLNDIDFTNNNFLLFVIGFCAFSLIWMVFWKKFRFFSIFEHEFTHLIISLLFFHKPKAFYADEDRGGWVKIAGTNFIITLGPYFLLTLCLLILPVYLVLKPQFYPYYFFFIGVLTSYHTLSTIKEISFTRQTDIIFNGKIFSFLVILLGNIINYGIVVFFVLSGFVGIRKFISSGWEGAVELIKLVLPI